VAEEGSVTTTTTTVAVEGEVGEGVMGEGVGTRNPKP
jgi:hypothetical protein